IANPGYVRRHGYICSRLTRSRLDSPANRYSAKTSFLNPERFTYSPSDSQSPRYVGCHPGQACGRCQSSLGKDKGRPKNNPERFRRQEERWNHSCRAKTAFAVNESSLGGKKEKWRQVNRSSRTGVPLFLLSWPFAEEAGLPDPAT